jgi:hypothetical protein
MSAHPGLIVCACPGDCRIPHGMWFFTRTETSSPYPCRCDESNHRTGPPCPCDGRTDTKHLPATCCAATTLRLVKP